jgi:hypothetical protein
MLALGEARLKEYIRTIGLYNTKAKNIIRLSEILLRDHGGQVPREREALQTLPGVGRKTANVVLNVAFGQPTMAVDTHIFRLGNRSGLAPGKTPDAVEQALEERAGALEAPRPSLADPPWPLHLQGAKARLPRGADRSLRVKAKTVDGAPVAAQPAVETAAPKRKPARRPGR